MKRIVVALLLIVGCMSVAPVTYAQTPSGGSSPPPVISSKFAGVSPTTSPSRPVGKVFGLIALFVALVLFSEGFGILGGRIRNLSSRSPKAERVRVANQDP